MNQPFEPPPILSQLMPYHQATRNFTVRQAEKFIHYLAQWITTSNRLPARASVDKRGDNTLVMTVVIDTPDTPPDHP
ncbi:hypothetical protein KXD96_28330 (plasmid) [Mycobacterium sp. SMC-2]|uniref:hypothetical protein n=1 Tax=Mycobacterium sp. SMC-2 TaxID=2857058 RepID=UPI0021B4CCC1|nr:hypothetical protein [Mycobacterium sp. SMC-2]UXA06574.1 hypothetical protein KXD96_27805 [Mycobacterium sp. SMC-2]UXA09666.1 hypothetical protein KXD96_28330 [Mycobacterium sp. SMC-2]